MLAEGILIRLIYNRSCQQDEPPKSPASHKAEEGIWRQKLADIPKIQGFADGCEEWDEIPAGSSRTSSGNGPRWGSRKEEAGKKQEKQLKAPVSPALPIPRSSQSPGCIQLDPYRSWPCIHGNYPDLHIGGDRVGGHTCDSGCVLELPDGPVLLSMDLGHSPPWEHPRKPGGTSLPGEEAGDRSFMLSQEPLSNSALNKYLEAKVAELYKQFLEESLARCGSITNLLTCSWIRNSLEQISLQLSQEQRMESSRARGALLHSLALFGSRAAPDRTSSHFSTPNLHISSPAGQKQGCRM